MDRSNVCKLIAETYTVDSIGQRVPTETSRTVYCSVESSTRAEWLAAGQMGLNPEKTLRMFRYDYRGEQIVEVEGIRYTVYRTYEDKNDTIELYVERKVGNAD